jgi:hypothetical protein
VKTQPERSVGYGPASHYRDPSLLYHDFDWLEPSVPLPVTTPFVVLLSLVGMVALIWYRPPPTTIPMGVPFVVPVAFIVFWPGLTMRYGTEFLPLLTIGASMGIGAIHRWRGWDRRWWVRGVCSSLVIVGVLCTLSAVYQYKLFTWVVPEEDKARLRSMVD